MSTVATQGSDLPRGHGLHAIVANVIFIRIEQEKKKCCEIH